MKATLTALVYILALSVGALVVTGHFNAPPFNQEPAQVHRTDQGGSPLLLCIQFGSICYGDDYLPFNYFYSGTCQTSGTDFRDGNARFFSYVRPCDPYANNGNVFLAPGYYNTCGNIGCNNIVYNNNVWCGNVLCNGGVYYNSNLYCGNVLCNSIPYYNNFYYNNLAGTVYCGIVPCTNTYPYYYNNYWWDNQVRYNVCSQYNTC